MTNVKDVYQKGFAQNQRNSDNPRLRRILTVAAGLPKGKAALLDIGCGDGSYTNELAETLTVNNRYGVDIASKAVALAKKNGLEAENMDIDEKDLPYKDETFDYVFSGNTIELIHNPDHLLTEVHRTLKKDGVAIISFPNLCSWASRIAVLFGFLPYYFRVSTKYDLGKMMSPTTKGDSTGFIRLQSLSSFKEMARVYNFKVVKAVGAGEKHLPAPLRIVDAVLSRFPSLAFQIICVLEKA